MVYYDMKPAKRDGDTPDTKCVHGTKFGTRCLQCEECIHGIWHGATRCDVCNPQQRYI